MHGLIAVMVSRKSMIVRICTFHGSANCGSFLPLFAAGIDLAVRANLATSQPSKFSFRRRLLRLALATEFAVLRGMSLLLGVEPSYMALYRATKHAANC